MEQRLILKLYFVDLIKTLLFILIGLLIKILNFFKTVYVFPKRKRNNDIITINIISKQNQELNVPSSDYFFSMKLFKKNPNIFFEPYHLSSIKLIELKFKNFTKMPEIRKFIEKINFNNILFTKKNLRTKLIRIFL
ncbi:MAG: hypothetical protein CMF98_07155 [Candidatus Marinimicrobia bacterium]|nr:hypothetical protein [Candidatus Neomarinimicrobiota bacterium]|tara:strand:+ start:3772 stop:4179 length:408 start_codon:yes stop_codon:yes gene_type:complete